MEKLKAEIFIKCRDPRIRTLIENEIVQFFSKYDDRLGINTIATEAQELGPAIFDLEEQEKEQYGFDVQVIPVTE